MKSLHSVIILVHLYISTILSESYREILIERYVFDGVYFNEDVMLETGMENADDPSSNRYSIIGIDCDTFDEYLESDGKYRFKLIWEQPSGTYELEWKQSSCLQSSTIEGYEPISIPSETTEYDFCLFQGLGRDPGEYVFIDGTGDSSVAWWNAIAPFVEYDPSGFPGFNAELAQSNELYILAPGVDCTSFEIDGFLGDCSTEFDDLDGRVSDNRADIDTISAAIATLGETVNQINDEDQTSQSVGIFGYTFTRKDDLIVILMVFNIILTVFVIAIAICYCSGDKRAIYIGRKKYAAVNVYSSADENKQLNESKE